MSKYEIAPYGPKAVPAIMLKAGASGVLEEVTYEKGGHWLHTPTGAFPLSSRTLDGMGSTKRDLGELTEQEFSVLAQDLRDIPKSDLRECYDLAREQCQGWRQSGTLEQMYHLEQ